MYFAAVAVATVFEAIWLLLLGPGPLWTVLALIALVPANLAGVVLCLLLPRAVFVAGARFAPALREANELLPRYRGDNLFDTSRFTERFPEFRVTPYRRGIEKILAGS